MNTTFFLNHSLPQRQQGAVLIVSLILLVILTMLGISAMESTKLETKMAVNIDEVNRALQNAEVGLANTVNSLDVTAIVKIINKEAWQPKISSGYEGKYVVQDPIVAEGNYPSSRCTGECSKRIIIVSTGCSQKDDLCGKEGATSPTTTLRRGISYGPIPVDPRGFVQP